MKQLNPHGNNMLRWCLVALVTFVLSLPAAAQSFGLPCKKYPASVPFKTEGGVDRYWHVTSVKCLGPANGGYKFRISGMAKKSSRSQNVDLYYIMPGNKLRVAGAYFFPAITEGSPFSFTVLSAFKGYAPSRFNGFFILNKFLAAELRREQEAAAEEETEEQEEQTVQAQSASDSQEEEEEASIKPVATLTPQRQETASQTIVASRTPYSIVKYSPSFSYAWPGLSILKVTITENYTQLEMQFNNALYHEGWININGGAYLMVPGTSIQARLKSVSGISKSPGHTNINYSEVRKFTLTFESLPKNTTVFDFYETPTSRWKIQGVRVK